MTPQGSQVFCQSHIPALAPQLRAMVPPQDDEDEGTWPTHFLRVGIGTVARAPYTDGSGALFHVVCDCLPVISSDCVEIEESTEDISNKTTRKRGPIANPIPAIAKDCP